MLAEAVPYTGKGQEALAKGPLVWIQTPPLALPLFATQKPWGILKHSHTQILMHYSLHSYLLPLPHWAPLVLPCHGSRPSRHGGEFAPKSAKETHCGASLAYPVATGLYVAVAEPGQGPSYGRTLVASLGHLEVFENIGHWPWQFQSRLQQRLRFRLRFWLVQGSDWGYQLLIIDN